MVLQVFDSPAAEAGLARGDRVEEIDGQAVSALVADGRIDDVRPPDEGLVRSCWCGAREARGACG